MITANLDVALMLIFGLQCAHSKSQPPVKMGVSQAMKEYSKHAGQLSRKGYARSESESESDNENIRKNHRVQIQNTIALVLVLYSTDSVVYPYCFISGRV